MAKKDFMSLMKEKTMDVRPSVLSAETTIKTQIIVIDQLRDLIPPLTEEELAQLEQNILSHGVKDPLTLWETTEAIAGISDQETWAYVLIDGHNRYRICTHYKLDYRINIVHFDSLTEVKEYMIDYQLGRRNLSSEQASYLRGTRYLQQRSARGSNLRAGGPQVNVAELLAAEYGVSSRTIKRDGEFAAGLETLDPESKRNVLAGKQKMTKSVVQARVVENESADHLESRIGNQKTKQINKLESKIKTLANNRLTLKSCTELIHKANDLLVLLSSK